MTERPLRWSPAVVVLHWINAALIVFLLALGLAMTHSVFDAGTTSISTSGTSRSASPRSRSPCCAWPRGCATARPCVAGRDGLLARIVQAALYLLTLAAIAAGWLVVSTSPLPVPTQVFGLFVMPTIAAPDAALFAAARLAHQIAAYAVAALVALHVAGALKHLAVDRDDVVRRMLPWATTLVFPRRARAGTPSLS